jgi:hypothetical protein
MNMRHLLQLTGAALVMLTANPAHANMVNVTGGGNGWTALWNAQIGQYGNLYNWYTTPLDSGVIQGFQEGTIPAQSEIVFSYSQPGFEVFMHGGYSDGLYVGDVNAGIGGQSNILFGPTSATYNAALMTAFVSLNGEKAELVNFSNVTASFETAFVATGGETPTASYAVTGLPLPSALPMFVAAMLGLFGLTYRRQRRRRYTY